MKRSIYFILLLLSFGFDGVSQSSSELKTQLESKINSIRLGETVGSINWKNETDFSIKQTLSFLENATTDSLVEVRSRIYRWVKMAYLSVDDEKLKVSLSNIYVGGLRDENVSIASNVARGLQQIKVDHFSSSSREIMISSLNPRPAYYSDLVLSLAYIDEKSAINPLIDDIRYEFKSMDQMEKWNVHIALSRLGEKPALDYIVKKARAIEINDDVIYEIYPSLAFTRQKEALNILVEQLYNESKNCSSPDPNSSNKITCAFRIMEILAPVIADYPISYDPISQDLMVDDYRKALKEVRKWFEKHRVDYVILKS